MKAKAAGRLVIAAVLLCSCAVPAIADTRTEVGIFTAVAGGTHVGADNPPVSGLFPIAALDVRQHVNGVWLQFEGIPPITVSGANNGAFGSSSAHLSVVNGTVNVDVDRHRRYHLGAGFQFVELNLMVDPNVRATLYAVTNTGVPEPTKPEQGAEVDYSAAYGWRRGMIEYLVGLRGLSYHTRNNDRPGELVDRNVGGGVTFEARFLFGPKE